MCTDVREKFTDALLTARLTKKACMVLLPDHTMSHSRRPQKHPHPWKHKSSLPLLVLLTFYLFPYCFPLGVGRPFRGAPSCKIPWRRWGGRTALLKFHSENNKYKLKFIVNYMKLCGWSESLTPLTRNLATRCQTPGPWKCRLQFMTVWKFMKVF